MINDHTPNKSWAAQVTWQPSIRAHAPLVHADIVYAPTAQAAHRTAAAAFRRLYPASTIQHIAISRTA